MLARESSSDIPSLEEEERRRGTQTSPDVRTTLTPPGAGKLFKNHPVESTGSTGLNLLFSRNRHFPPKLSRVNVVSEPSRAGTKRPTLPRLSLRHGSNFNPGQSWRPNHTKKHERARALAEALIAILTRYASTRRKGSTWIVLSPRPQRDVLRRPVSSPGGRAARSVAAPPATL